MPTNVNPEFRRVPATKSEGLRPHQTPAYPRARSRSSVKARSLGRGRNAQLLAERNRRRKASTGAMVPRWMLSLLGKGPGLAQLKKD